MPTAEKVRTKSEGILFDIEGVGPVEAYLVADFLTHMSAAVRQIGLIAYPEYRIELLVEEIRPGSMKIGTKLRVKLAHVNDELLDAAAEGFLDGVREGVKDATRYFIIVTLGAIAGMAVHEARPSTFNVHVGPRTVQVKPLTPGAARDLLADKYVCYNVGQAMRTLTAFKGVTHMKIRFGFDDEQDIDLSREDIRKLADACERRDH